MEVKRLSTARFLPRPPNHHRPLSVETPNFHPCTSVEWLAENGLRARNLNLYQVVLQRQIHFTPVIFFLSRHLCAQVLAPNAFDPVRDFIPILRKPVGSKIHEVLSSHSFFYDFMSFSIFCFVFFQR